MEKENTAAFVFKVGKREREGTVKARMLARSSQEDARLASHSQQTEKKMYT